LLFYILFFILSLISLFLVYAVYYFYRSLKPPRFITPVLPSHYGLSWENVTFETSDHVQLRGWFIPNPGAKSAVIVCHGYPFDKGNLLPLAKFLHADHHLFLFDFRAMGESGGKLSTVGFLERLDVAAALDYLDSKGIQKIGVLGYSLGGAVALFTARNEKIRSVVADSPFSSMDQQMNDMLQNLFFLKKFFIFVLKHMSKVFLRIDLGEIQPAKAVENLRKPILIIHGNEDHQVRLSHTEYFKKSNPGILFWIVPGCGHGAAHEMFREEYEKRVGDFFRQTLRE
jgi:pimeloyl-ACP methyl ester carboxylesterase